MSPGTRPCDQPVAAGRLNKAEQFLDAAETIREFADDEAEVGDVFVTLCVHAGIAAADVVCCTELGRHAQGDDHNQAVALIGQLRPDGNELGKDLRTLLTMKTRAGYGHRTVVVADCERAGRAAERLLRAARDRHRR